MPYCNGAPFSAGPDNAVGWTRFDVVREKQIPEPHALRMFALSRVKSYFFEVTLISKSRYNTDENGIFIATFPPLLQLYMGI